MSVLDEAREHFEAVYRRSAPWDIGRPQPAMLALIDEFPPSGAVLDAGCGTGELAIALAKQGLTVTGVDFAEAAIAQARQKAAAAGPDIGGRVEFKVGDALRPSQLKKRFGAVVDSGFYHQLGREERETFVQELAASLESGGRYYLLGFAFDSPFPHAPRQVRESELREMFTAGRGWRVLALRPAQFLNRAAPNGVPALAACFERVPQG